LNLYADPKEFSRLICWIADNRVSIRVDGPDIFVSIPGRKLTDDERSLLRRFKSSLIQIYGQTSSSYPNLKRELNCTYCEPLLADDPIKIPQKPMVG
jgi:hypothetical protein